MMAHKWYAIQTHAGSERSVKLAIENLVTEYALQDIIIEIIVPTEDVIEVKNGKKKISERSLYSGYVFAKIELDTAVWHKIQSIPKVSGFIGESKNPTPLSENDIKNILERVNNRQAPKPKIAPNKTA